MGALGTRFFPDKMLGNQNRVWKRPCNQHLRKQNKSELAVRVPVLALSITQVRGGRVDERVNTSTPTVLFNFHLKIAGAHARLFSKPAEFPDITVSQSLTEAVCIKVINRRLKSLYFEVYCRMKNIAVSVTLKTFHPRCHLICQNSSQKCFILA